MGRLILNKKYIYIASGIGLSPNINDLKFYDTGLTYNGRIRHQDETNTYWLVFVSNTWIIALLGNTGGGIFAKFGGTPVGSYSGFNGYSGTVTISEYKNKISIKKENTGGRRLVVAPRPPTISNITSGSSGGGIGGGGI
jgi:hypothetical protein